MLERQEYADAPEALEKFERIGRVVKRFGSSVLYDLEPRGRDDAESANGSPRLPPDWLLNP